MGKSSKATSGAVGQSNLLYFLPEQLRRVTDPEHPLYQKRAEKPVTEDFVASLRRTHGNAQPVVLRPNGKDENGIAIMEIVAGRRRVNGIAILRERMSAEGTPDAELPVVKAILMERGSTVEDCVDVMAIENAHRDDLDELEKAEDICRMLKRGRQPKDVAEIYRISVTSVKNYEQVHSLHADCKKAIREGMPITVVKELHELPQEQQPEALAKLVEAGLTKGARGREGARQLARHDKEAKPTTVPMMRRPAIEAWVKRLRGQQLKKASSDLSLAQALLRRVLGKEDALVHYPNLAAALADEADADGKKAKPKKAAKA